MAQSYLGGDRFGALDSSFQTGIQLGTQIVRERLERQQKLQDQQTQQQAELAAEKNRADLQLRNNAAELAQASAQKATDAKAAINDPVLYRANQWETRSAQLTAAYDSQDKLNEKILDPNDPSYSADDRAAARSAIQQNYQRRQMLAQSRPQQFDATTPVKFPDTDPQLAPDPNNVVTPQYTDEFRASKNKAAAMDPVTRAETIFNYKHGIEQKDANLKAQTTAFSKAMGNLSAYNPYSGEAPTKLNPITGQNELDMQFAKNKQILANKANSSVFSITGALTDPEFINHFANDPGDTGAISQYVQDKLSPYGPSPTADDLLKVQAQVLSDANAYNPNGSPHARGISKSAQVVLRMLHATPTGETPSSEAPSSQPSGESDQEDSQ